MRPSRLSNFALHLFLAASVIATGISPASAYSSPTFTGIGQSTAGEYTWVTLNGSNLSHVAGRDEGYESVYFYETDASNNIIGGAQLIPSSRIRSNPANDGSIQIVVPAGVPYMTFQIDACDNWSVSFQCRSLFTSDFLHASPALTLSFSGLATTQGLGYQWITLNGSNLSHEDSITAGWQAVFFKAVGAANWTAISFSNIRNDPANGANGTSAIQVKVPATSGTYLFHVDACAIWDPSIGAFGCLSFEPTDTYEIVNPSTFTGITPTSGATGTWVTLQGANLSHATSHSPGYQTVYYGSPGSWVAITDTSTIRDNPANDGSIQVRAPIGITSTQFHIDVCTDWEVGTDLSAGKYCYGLDNAGTFTVTEGNLGIHPNNGGADTNTTVTIGNTYQLPPALTRAHFIFKEWNTASNGSGTPYAPGTEIVISGDTDIYAQWISETDPLISLYIDAPFVQGSYAVGSKVRTEDFNSFPTTGQGSCNGATFNVGVVTAGTCSIFDSPDLGASSTSAAQVVGGSGSKMVSNYKTSGTQSYTITFTNNMKYVGFWWSAGSTGNSVEFLAGGNAVVTMNVNQLNGIFGSVPATDADYAVANTSVQAINGNTYFKKYYFGNPDGYVTTSPTVRSTSNGTTPDTPYVYIHAFADNGAYFDGIRISGYGFELDNLTVSQATVAADPRLVYVQGITANSAALNAAEKIYFVTYHNDGSTAGSVPVDNASPYALNETATVLGNTGSLVRSGYQFNGWRTSPAGGVTYAAGDTLTVTDDVELYPVWLQNSPPQQQQQQSTPSSNSPSLPGIAWDPAPITSGEKLGDAQLNAVFSVPGTVKYDPPAGTVITNDNSQITVTFTPENTTQYLALSTTRNLEVTPPVGPSTKPTPTPSPTSGSTSNPATVPTEKPTTVKKSSMKLIGTIYFNSNEYFLDLADRVALRKISDSINFLGATEVFVEGNTDFHKGVDNVWLSRSRAEAARVFLEKLKSRPHYTSMWFADTKPVAFGISKESLAANRRVDIYIPVMEESESVSGTSPKIVKDFPSISFNRNDFFLDAGDRATLIKIISSAAKQKCVNITLRGSRDSTTGIPNSTIAENRERAVQRFMKSLYPAFKFTVLPSITSAKREVSVSCSN